MKKLFMLIFLTISLCMPFLDVKCMLANENNQKRNNYKAINGQSFIVKFENWGEVRFESGLKNGKVEFFLTDEKDRILYAFPDFYIDKWSFYQIRAISFKDVNKDGLKDVVIIAEYMTGVGKEGAIPFPICNIYFQQDKKFVNLEELDNEINNTMHNKDISTVIKFTEGKKSQIDELLMRTK